jgi:2-phosphoglycerate kinase
VIAPDRNIQSKYLSYFERIWALQSYLLSEADNSAMQILENNDKEKTTDRFMQAIIDVLREGFTKKASDVFGP